MSRTPHEALQILSLAIELEQRSALLYQEWAHRFAPYDIGISGLLKVLAEEERSHAREFHGLQEELSIEGLMEDVSLPPEFNACMERLRAIEDRFFVTGPVMAITILEAAFEIEEFTGRFYRDLESRATDPKLAAACRRLSEFEEDHGRIFLERLEYERQKQSA